eukprot:767822-Hanusia_phi.AAC.1
MGVGVSWRKPRPHRPHLPAGAAECGHLLARFAALRRLCELKLSISAKESKENPLQAVVMGTSDLTKASESADDVKGAAVCSSSWPRGARWGEDGVWPEVLVVEETSGASGHREQGGVSPALHVLPSLSLSSLSSCSSVALSTAVLKAAVGQPSRWDSTGKP